MKLPLYTIEGKKKGTIEVPKEVFSVEVHPDLLHQGVVTAQANMRSPVAHVKDRSEVSGGGRKPWRQKGTGRARHGSSRSPLWVGGGVTFGPRKDRTLSKDLPKKMKRKALLGALSLKAKSNEVLVVENLVFPEPKTKHGVQLLTSLYDKGSAIVWGASADTEFTRVFRNIPRVTSCNIANFNLLDILNHAHVIFSQSALETLIKQYGSSRLVHEKEKKASSK